MVNYGVDHQLKIPEVAARVSLANTLNAAERLVKAEIKKRRTVWRYK